MNVIWSSSLLQYVNLFHKYFEVTWISDTLIKASQWSLTMGISHEIAETILKESLSFCSMNPFVSWSSNDPTESPGSFFLLMCLKKELLVVLVPMNLCCLIQNCSVLFVYFIFNFICQYLWSLMINMTSAFRRSLLVSKVFLCLPVALCFLLCLKCFLTPEMALCVLQYH